ncbi:Hint domain-containing protein [Swaminathania salitolerans]|uniref:Hedgehog/Intein (Hint) domain-containing protein n=1 Tax=Swaminathania salitolerans TaxID=182838 RepID=A0A511BRJ9_9PROT|nr:Hint domain-containing protein [Swaminathania salitolerans]GBQ14239.1 outer membrane protein [Swaminathania salitolerans LMG 21291]GEL02961.1 hypothetical protein SSA02_21240 [Swaminathania salitolerans]
MPDQIFSTGNYTFSGSYFTVSDNKGCIDLGDVHNDVDASIDGWKIDFDDPQSGDSISWDYDYSWGNPDWGILILGSTNGAYHIVFLGDQVVDWKSLEISYPGSGKSSGAGNDFLVTIDGVTVRLTQDDSGTAPQRFTPCYLAGTRVETPDGPRAIETLNIDDEIFVTRADGTSIETIRWIGSSLVHPDPERPDDMSGYPVCIRAGALGENLPNADLHVTAEHGIFVEGQLIPARMLVNGGSIAYRRDMQPYRIFHLRTRRHALITVNGILSETLHGSGKADWRFETTHGTIPEAMSDAIPGGESDPPCYPMNTDRSFVEPIHRRIATRCGTRFSPGEAAFPAAIENSVRLVLPDGSEIKALRRVGNQIIFPLDASVRRASLETATSRPCDRIGPFVDDRRALGLLVGDITLYGACSTSPVMIDFMGEDLKGWHPVERADMRWTKGRAEIALPESLPETLTALPSILAIRVVPLMEETRSPASVAA